MTAYTSLIVQHRTFDNVYLFRLGKKNCVVQVLDVAQTCLKQVTYPRKRLVQLSKAFNIEYKEREVSDWLRELISAKAIEILPDARQSNLNQAFSGAIKQLEQVVSAPKDVVKHIICPITQESPRNAVIDEHGHTFDQAAINKWFQTSPQHLCPINRQPIYSLTPNLAVRNLLENGNGKQKVIPFPNEMKSVNNKDLASGIRSQGVELEKLDKTQDAIDMYKKSLEYSGLLSDYEKIAELFEKIDKIKAIIANLYLARYHLEAGAFDRAFSSMENSQKLWGQATLGGECVLGEKIKKKVAVLFYQELLVRKVKNPSALKVYEKLGLYYQNTQKRRNLFIKAGLHFVRLKKYELANNFYCKSDELKMWDWLAYVELTVAQKNIKHVKKYGSLLVSQALSRKDWLLALVCYRHIAELTKDPKDFIRVIAMHEKISKHLEAAEWRIRLLERYVEMGNWTFAKSIYSENIDCFRTLKLGLLMEGVYEKAKDYNELEKIRIFIASCYVEKGKYSEAEVILKKIIHHNPSAKNLLTLAEVNLKTGNIKEAVKNYCNVISLASERGSEILVSQCISKVKQVDPKFTFLTQEEQNKFLYESKLSALRVQLSTSQKEVQEKNVELESCGLKIKQLSTELFKNRYVFFL